MVGQDSNSGYVLNLPLLSQSPQPAGIPSFSSARMWLWPVRRQPWVKALGPTTPNPPLACCYHFSSWIRGVPWRGSRVAGFSQLARKYFDIYRTSSVIQLCSYKVSCLKMHASVRLRGCSQSRKPEWWAAMSGASGCPEASWRGPAAWGSEHPQDPHPSLRGSGLSSGLVSESEASEGK